MISYPARSALRGSLGAEFLFFQGATEISVDNEVVGLVPAVNFRGFLGLTYAF